MAMIGNKYFGCYYKLLIEDGRIIFDNYKKSTNSGRYLNFFSNHPVEHKRDVVIVIRQNFIPFPS